MKEKIIKLIQSTVWDDVVLGINLAYNLDSQTFSDTMYDLDIFCKYPGNVLFRRDGIVHIFGHFSIFPWPEDKEGIELFYNYKDLTP